MLMRLDDDVVGDLWYEDVSGKWHVEGEPWHDDVEGPWQGRWQVEVTRGKAVSGSRI